ncbi:MAG: single-stranded-DNA-specific exonuclease RecJ [Gammaproteobacteria bacterium]|nr:single-stranded-DNA-specific exonuclease RecJ [Gammaproteobacteria bacterium]
MLIAHRAPLSAKGNFSQKVHPLLQRIYLARGLSNDEELELRLQKLLPFHSLSGIENAVHLLFKNLKEQGRVLIIGDFDADGATSTVVAIKALQAMGFLHVDFLVPNRFKFGYGLTPEIVEVAATAHPNLIVTVDNGISSIEGVEAARQKEISVLVTDHHLPGACLPPADATVNPNLPCDLFPSKHLAGVGVIFYVMLALRAFLREQHWFLFQGKKEPNLAELLDLVALGTVADVVPFDQNNRILVHHGLTRIQTGRACAGIRALLSIAGKKFHSVTTSDLGFLVAPRLNAAGRLEDMSVGIRCLLAKELKEALPLARELDALNRERRNILATMEQEANDTLASLRLEPENIPFGLCVYHPSWHPGVIGILAGKLKERFHRPVIAFAQHNAEELKGSGRSIPGVHIRDVLEAIATRYPNLIKGFGGHAMAAGLSITPDHYERFKLAFNETLSGHLQKEHLQGKIMTDGTLKESDFCLEMALALKQAGPWGQNFPEPCFDGKFQILEQRLVAKKHLKMRVVPMDTQSTTKPIEAIAFNIEQDKWPNPHCQYAEFVYQLNMDDYTQDERLVLRIEHLRPFSKE